MKPKSRIADLLKAGVFTRGDAGYVILLNMCGMYQNLSFSPPVDPLLSTYRPCPGAWDAHKAAMTAVRSAFLDLMAFLRKWA